MESLSSCTMTGANTTKTSDTSLIPGRNHTGGPFKPGPTCRSPIAHRCWLTFGIRPGSIRLLKSRIEPKKGEEDCKVWAADCSSKWRGLSGRARAGTLVYTDLEKPPPTSGMERRLCE